MSRRIVVTAFGSRSASREFDSRSLTVSASRRSATSAWARRSLAVLWAEPTPLQQQVTEPGVVEDGLFETGPIP